MFELSGNKTESAVFQGALPQLSVPRERDALLTRRAFLRVSAAAAALLAPALPHAALAAPLRTLAFDNLHTGEKLSVIYARGDVYLPESLAAMNHLLRDHRSGDEHPIDPALFDLLYDLQCGFGGCGLARSTPYQVISGYRSPATNAQLIADGRGVAKKSLHMQGQAIDVRLPDVDMWSFRQAAVAMRVGGVGYYKSPNFVHLDTGRVRTW